MPHNHKSDPISQTDYYSMQAIFAGVQHGERVIKTSEDEARVKEATELEKSLAGLEDAIEHFEPLARLGGAGPDGASAGATNTPRSLRAPVNPRRNVERFAPVEAKYVRFTILATSGAEPCIDELEIFSTGADPRNVALADAGAKATASGTYPNSDLHRLEHINDGRYGNSRSWISSESGAGWIQIELPQKTLIDKLVWGRDREEKFGDRLATRYVIETAVEPGKWRVIAGSADRQPYVAGAPPRKDGDATGLSVGEAAELKSLLARAGKARERLGRLKAQPKIYGGVFAEPEATYLLYRGDPLQKREQVTPSALEAFGPKTHLKSNSPEQERRLALARWIIDPQNPMTARVMVNRIWQHHFGEGLVGTPSDFGLNGARPSHPELLDWLAVEFQQRGGSIKTMHRLMVLSEPPIARVANRNL